MAERMISRGDSAAAAWLPDALPSSERPVNGDLALIEETRSGSPDAFLELWVRHVSSVARFTYRLIGSEAATHSVINEAFAAVMLDIARDRPDRHRIGLEPFRLSVYRAVADLVGHPLPSRDAVPAVLRGLRRLSPRLQSILWYRDVEAVQAREVGRLLGESPADIVSARSPALERLRAEWILTLLEDPTVRDSCAWNLRRAGSRSTGSLSWASTARYDRHQRGCSWCQSLGQDLDSPATALVREAVRIFTAPRSDSQPGMTPVATVDELR